MRSRNDRLLFSPTDLCRFVESRFASWMERQSSAHPERFVPEPPAADLEMLRRRGTEHEEAYIASLVEAGGRVFDPREERDNATATLEAMQRGEPMIQQAYLSHDRFVGYADLLVRVDGVSRLGDHHYIPREVKLGLSPQPKYILQLCAYVEMLEAIQERRPDRCELVLGNRDLISLRTADHQHYYIEQRRAFLEFHDDFDEEHCPTPWKGEDHGQWSAAAAEYLEQVDHLSRVANIRKTQIGRLEAAGITTMTALAQSGEQRIPKLNPAQFARLRRQAQLQIESAGRDRPSYEILTPDDSGAPRGLSLLPPPSSNDVFFDMEGYPFMDGGLEYLFGASYQAGEELRFSDWWGHDRDQEKFAFESFIDWAHARWREDPSMHIYHYAPYETTALKRLMSMHATREARLDQLLRNEVFVDLYAIVRHGLLVGEPKYSIKNLERLFREHRGGEVQSAIDSVAEYQRFKDSGEPTKWQKSPILEGIRDYNKDDCDSTLELTRWLRARQREAGIRYRGRKPVETAEDAEAELSEGNRRRQELARRLMHDERDTLGCLLGQLVEFHRREDKPKWWELYRRHEMTDDELYEDLSCLGGLQRIDGSEHPIRNSTGIRYRFDPDQDTKLDAGKQFYLAHDLDLEGKIEEIDRELGEITLCFPPSTVNKDSWPPPARVSLIPREFIPIDPLQRAVERLALEWERHGTLPHALDSFLRRRRPGIMGLTEGPIVRADETPSDACVRVVPRMLQSALSIQGPPGTGKTFTAARVILELIGRGKRVGITSNSHKAILNLMAKCAELHGGELRCLKVGGDHDDPLLLEIPGVERSGGGRDGATNARAHKLIGGTAWLFAHEAMHEAVDYLFVDEAGQVSLANLVAMASSTRNLVLVGDQMQLGQPTQAVHPDDSGRSTLEYLLGDEATIPPEQGVFLDVSYRLHPAICRVNSEAFYQGRLHSAPGRENRTIGPQRAAGIVFVPVEHEGNTQGSDEEAEAVHELFAQLQGVEYTDLDGTVAGKLGVADVLVVAPYNMQVRKLRDVLPDGARVGSVDKFQGQEAPVVIISMCASEGHDSPRGIEFLLNPNRLNVALSRAQSLVYVVGHPGLARTRCRTPEQMKLVNLYCRLAQSSAKTPVLC